VVGVRRTTATVSALARIATCDPRFGGFFFGVQPSSFGPLGRMVEGSPGGSPFVAPDLPETLPGNEGEAAVNVRLYRRFLDLRKCSFSEARLLAPERAFPKTGQVGGGGVKRLAEPLAGLTGREAAFPNASPEADSGKFKNERQPFRVSRSGRYCLFRL